MYILSIIAVIAVIILSGWYNQGLWGYLIDTPSFLLILILWIPIMLSSGLFGDLGKAFQFAVGGKKIKKCSELKRAEEAVTLAIKTLLASGALIAAVPLITYFRNITDVAKIGPSIIVTILPMVYTIGFSIILLPLRSRIRVKIIEFMVETEEEPLEEHENEA